MTNLEKLRKAEDLTDLAAILGYTAASLSFVIYKIPDDSKYTTFTIPKRSGGTRTILAPTPALKKLQKHLANVLAFCADEIDRETPRQPLSHGFRKGRSILTNASLHRRHRYVLNVDIEGFFPSFNFGRVRGYFIKYNNFMLKEKVATIIAQIACFDNQLPQGSPCSPIISDLIAHVLDVRLVKLAKTHLLTYSRYADDLTFSTSRRHFPTEIAAASTGAAWAAGYALEHTVRNAGFELNMAKTRMHFKQGRQLVTGIVVNTKLNVTADMYRQARSACQRLFTTGTYFLESPTESTASISRLEGILNHIDYVRVGHLHWKDRPKGTPGHRNLFKRFLYFKHLHALTAPLIFCEGKTDPVYLRCAIKRLTAFQPALGAQNAGEFKFAVRFLKHSKQSAEILHVRGGSGDINNFLKEMPKALAKFTAPAPRHPVIFLMDSDKGADDTFATIKKLYNVTITHDSPEPFFHLTKNLRTFISILKFRASIFMYAQNPFWTQI